MTSLTPDWPRKTRDLHNHHFDSTVQDDYRFRDGDIVIATYAKSGTTWTQQIVGQLLSGGDGNLEVGELSPWVDLRVPPKEVKLAALQAQSGRRFVKTHLPVDALVFSPGARYLYVGRDGRDVVWSLFNHHRCANASWYEALNDTPSRVGPPIGSPSEDVRGYFLDWLERDGHPFWPFWENVASWQAIRKLPNLLLLHFADLKTDMPGQIRRIAAFLDVEVDPARWDTILEHCGFAWVKEHAAKSAPLGGAFWEGGGATFIHRGTNGRWREILTADDNARYERLARERLGEDCARWLAAGSPFQPNSSS